MQLSEGEVGLIGFGALARGESMSEDAGEEERSDGTPAPHLDRKVGGDKSPSLVSTPISSGSLPQYPHTQEIQHPQMETGRLHDEIGEKETDPNPTVEKNHLQHPQTLNHSLKALMVMQTNQ